MGKVKKDAVYDGILPQLMTFLCYAWIILIPFGLFIIIKILNFLRHMVKGF